VLRHTDPFGRTAIPPTHALSLCIGAAVNLGDARRVLLAEACAVSLRGVLRAGKGTTHAHARLDVNVTGHLYVP
jgi:hypothetical protein